MMEKKYLIVATLLVIVSHKWVNSTGTLDELSVRPLSRLRIGRPRSEIDLETEKSVVICAGQNKSLECFSPGSSISIKEAFWGRLSAEICPSEDGDPVTNCQNDPTTTPIVQKLCDDKEYCEIPARHSILQPPGTKHCPGVNKYLSIKYTCMPEKRKFVLCTGETTDLHCGEGWKVHVISAYWGRDSPSTCPTPLGKFFTCANSPDSLVALRERCSEKESCLITANDEHLTKDNNHCPGIDKYAVITYNCQLKGQDPGEHPEDEKKVLELPKQATENDQPFLVPKISVKGKSASGAATDQVNVNTLLPVPQYNKSDAALKPIIEFLDEDSGEENVTSQKGKLSIPQDVQIASPKKANLGPSLIQDGIAPSVFATQSGITAGRSKPPSEGSVPTAVGFVASDVSQRKPASLGNKTALINAGLQKQSMAPPSSSLSSSSSVGNIQGSLLPSATVNALFPHGLSSPSPTPNYFKTATQSLLEGLLASKFGQALGNGLISSFASLQTSSNQNSLGRKLAATSSNLSSPNAPTPENKGLINNVISGLIGTPQELQGKLTSQPSTGSDFELSNKKMVSVKTEKTSPDNLSSPTISIGKNVFSLAGLSNLLKDGDDNKEWSPNVLKALNPLFGGETNGDTPTRKKNNKEKIKQLNEKISTLETLSDALDALTSQLSHEGKTKNKINDKEEQISAFSSDLQKQERIHKKHHSHHKKSHQFEEDIDMLNSLLSSTEKHSKTERKPSNVGGDKDEEKYIIGIRKPNSLGQVDLETLQRKINKAIEMAETMGRKEETNHVRSTWLPLLVAGQVVKDVGAQTREEVAKLHNNHTVLKGNFNIGQSDIETLQQIIKTLIENSLRKGTLNELIERWNHSGSPFADIAKNISLTVHRIVREKTVNSPPIRPVLPSDSSTSPRQTEGSVNAVLLAKTPTRKQATTPTEGPKVNPAFKTSNQNQKATRDNVLFQKAVDSIIGALRKRHGVQRNSTRNLLAFDTLTTVNGVTLGGRISKQVTTADLMNELKTNILFQQLGGIINQSVSYIKGDASNAPTNEAKNNTKAGLGKQEDFPGKNNNTSQKIPAVAHKTAPREVPKKTSRKFGNEPANETLMEFMNNNHETPSNKLMLNYSPSGVTVGYKHNRLKPHLRELITEVAETLMSLGDTKTKALQKGAKIKYDEGGIKTDLPNDHRLSDFSNADAILQAPNDHVDRRNGSHILSGSALNKTRPPDLKKKKLNMDSSKSDSEDTVTVTLETLDDAPTVAPIIKSNPAKETADSETSLRSNKVPHLVNIQSAITLGKINATSANNKMNSFTPNRISQVPAGFSGNIVESSLPKAVLPSDGNLNVIIPLDDVSPNLRDESLTNPKPELSVGSQMKAIGRVAETAQINEAPPRAASGIFELASSPESPTTTAIKNKEVREDKVLPMTSDVTSAADNKGGDTARIVSKTVPPTPETPVVKVKSFATATESELPTRFEVREVAKSIHTLLKILGAYSRKLKMEEGKHDSAVNKGTTPSHSTGSKSKETVFDGKGSDQNKRINIKIEQANISLPSNAYSSIKEQPVPLAGTPYVNQNSRYAVNYSNNNNGLAQAFVNYPQTLPTVPNYVDTGLFENIQEQPTSEVSDYTWNRLARPTQAHAQVQVDANPAKDSLATQGGAGEVRPVNTPAESGSRLNAVPEGLKDFNIPSIEDDPTVQAVQKMVAEETSALANGKRKEIQKHQQPMTADSDSQTTSPGVFSRNSIPNKNKTHLAKALSGGKLVRTGSKNMTKNKASSPPEKRRNGSGSSRKSLVKSRDKIPRTKAIRISGKDASSHLERKLFIDKNTHADLSRPKPSSIVHSPKVTQTADWKRRIRGNVSQQRQMTSRDKIPRRLNGSALVATVKSNKNTTIIDKDRNAGANDSAHAQTKESPRVVVTNRKTNKDNRSEITPVKWVGKQNAITSGKVSEKIKETKDGHKVVLPAMNETLPVKNVTTQRGDKITGKKQKSGA